MDCGPCPAQEETIREIVKGETMEKQITINEALALTKAVRSRLSSLEQLRNEVSRQETYFGTKEKIVEPKYDVKAVDKKVAEINLFLYRVDAAIKASNAVTTLTIDVDVEKLLEPLQ